MAGENGRKTSQKGAIWKLFFAAIRDAPSPGRSCRLEVSGEESAGFWGRVSAGAREEILAACDPEHPAYPSASPRERGLEVAAVPSPLRSHQSFPSPATLLFGAGGKTHAPAASCQGSFFKKGEEQGRRELPGEEADDAHEDEVVRSLQPAAMEAEELSKALPMAEGFFPGVFSHLWFLW